ncbi:FMN reductase [Campylobacter upsaliensis]|nr:FMN reductase [Campylobacter upsaliensis]
MKQVAILAANGKTGRLLVKEALLQGASVCAFVRSGFDMQWLKESLQNEGVAQDEVLSRLQVVKKDIFALDSSDLAPFEVILDAFGEWQNLKLHTEHITHLAKILQGSKVMLFVVGGAGSLLVDSIKFVDTPNFPDEYKPLANAQVAVLEFLKGVKALKWCFVSPAAEFVPDLAKGANVQISYGLFQTNKQGKSIIGYADFAHKLCQIALDSASNYERKHIGLYAE